MSCCPVNSVVSLYGNSELGTWTNADFQFPRKEITMIVSVTGSPSSFSVSLEGSHDQTVWATLATVTTPGATTVDTHLIRYARANLTALSGGSSPAVSATIAAA